MVSETELKRTITVFQYSADHNHNPVISAIKVAQTVFLPENLACLGFTAHRSRILVVSKKIEFRFYPKVFKGNEKLMLRNREFFRF